MFTTLQQIQDFIAAKSWDCYFKNEINAWVFVWYPEDGHLGHAAMLIGDLSIESPYVSWCPKNTREGILEFFRKSPSLRQSTLNPETQNYEFETSSYDMDCFSEENSPHVIYGLRGLDVREMQMAWHNIVSRENSSFSPLSKNCASIVSRVLKAGLTRSPLRHRVLGVFYGGQYIWTPKRIAVICNLLRDNNAAWKIVVPERNSKKSLFKTLIRLR